MNEIEYQEWLRTGINPNRPPTSEDWDRMAESRRIGVNEYFAKQLRKQGWIVLPPSVRKVYRIWRLEITDDPTGLSYRWLPRNG